MALGLLGEIILTIRVLVAIIVVNMFILRIVQKEVIEDVYKRQILVNYVFAVI